MIFLNKKLIIFFVITLPISCLAQVDSLYNYVHYIDSMNFEDTISLSIERNHIKQKIKGYAHKGTFYKAEISYLEFDRIRTVYFSTEGYPPVCYVKEVDAKTNKVCLEIGYWKEKLIINNSENSLFESEKNSPSKIRSRSDIFYTLEHKYIDSLADKYYLEGIAVNIPKFQFACGFVWVTISVKFKIDSTDYPTNKKRISAIISCPLSYGNNFFKKGKKYKMIIATNSGVSLPEDEDANQELWVREIEIIDN